MLEFDEPDAKYEFDESKKKSGSAKIKILTLFLILALLLLFLAKNDYKFNILKPIATPVIIECNPLYKFDSQDNEITMTKNAGDVLEENLKKFEELEGFEKGYIKSRSVAQEGGKAPEIILEFKDIVRVEKEIPNKMCGFNATVIYK